VRQHAGMGYKSSHNSIETFLPGNERQYDIMT
jgi:hypothetical protein